jgi:hypothetical protein
MKFDKNLANGIGVGIILAIIPALWSLILLALPNQTSIPITFIILTLFLLIGTPIINSYYPIYAPSLFGVCIISLLLSWVWFKVSGKSIL